MEPLTYLHQSHRERHGVRHLLIQQILLNVFVILVIVAAGQVAVPESDLIAFINVETAHVGSFNRNVVDEHLDFTVDPGWRTALTASVNF